MPAWDIEPSGVQTVLVRTESAAHGIAAGSRGLQAALQAATSAAQSGPVSDALGALAEHVAASLQFASDRTARALGGTAKATRAYVTGDLTMAADAQQAAAAVSDPDLPGRGPRAR